MSYIVEIDDVWKPFSMGKDIPGIKEFIVNLQALIDGKFK